MIDDILKFNDAFVANKCYEAHAADKYPGRKLAILTCMDTRLTLLLPAALGLKNGDAKIIKNAGALIMHPYDSAMRSLLVAIYELGVEDIMVVAHTGCGACHMSSAAMTEAMLARGISHGTFDAVTRGGVDLVSWFEGFHDTEASVRRTVQTIVEHPLVCEGISVYGFIIDSATGQLTRVC